MRGCCKDRRRRWKWTAGGDGTGARLLAMDGSLQGWLRGGGGAGGNVIENEAPLPFYKAVR